MPENINCIFARDGSPDPVVIAENGWTGEPAHLKFCRLAWSFVPMLGPAIRLGCGAEPKALQAAHKGKSQRRSLNAHLQISSKDQLPCQR
jgi:hypothetical protein